MFHIMYVMLWKCLIVTNVVVNVSVAYFYLKLDYICYLVLLSNYLIRFYLNTKGKMCTYCN